MQTLEHDSIGLACAATGDNTPTAGYEMVRYNAMKHGILAKLAVLAHEDHDQFAGLLDAMACYNRVGPSAGSGKATARWWRRSRSARKSTA